MASAKSKILPLGTWIGQYKIIARIGKGTNSNVYSASIVDGNHQKIRALKVATTGSATEKLKKEYEILQKLPDSNYLPVIYGYVPLKKDKHRVDGGAICMKLYESKNLSIKIQNTTGKMLGPIHGSMYAAEMLYCLQTCHNAGIVHCDLKPSNFVAPRHKCWEHQISVVDFGESQMIETAGNHFVGTSRYGSIDDHDPNKKYGPIDDIWSFFFIWLHMAACATTWIGRFVGHHKYRSKMFDAKSKFVEGIATNASIHPQFRQCAAILKKGLTKRIYDEVRDCIYEYATDHYTKARPRFVRYI